MKNRYLTLTRSKGTDEYYTPQSAVSLIAPYISPDKTIWCPFDTKKSNFVSVFRARGNTVIRSHIDDGKDFLTYEPEKYDVIVSNPPYSLKNEVYARLFQLNKPFAMLFNMTGIFSAQNRFALCSRHGVELFIPKKRIKYFTDYADPEGSTVKSPPFLSVYVCHKLLPERLILEDVTA